jgi:hypothetical protein
MPRNRYTFAGGIIAFLMLANIVYYCFSGWGLITVNVQDVPLSKVIKNIEWQGWVKIYSNIDPQTKISMYVEKVPLPEALETLAINAGGQWKLGFFVGPSTTNVKETIHSFEAGITADTLKTYSYPTMLGMLTPGGEDDAPAPVGDPRLQSWPGVKAPVQVVPVSTNPTPPVPDAATPPPPGDNQPATPASPDSVQSYLRTFAQASDIFIMSDSSWDPPVSSPPPASSSVISAIKNFVSHNHGTVAQAFILQARGQRGPGGGGFRRGGFAGGEDTGWSTMEDRVRNAINGLPESARAGALSQLDQMEKLRKEMQNAPPEQRQIMRRQQMEARIADNPGGGPMGRMSPDKRAQRYQQMVSTRMSAQGK